MEFQVVWTAEDFADRSAINSPDERCAFFEPGSQDGMAKIGDGFFARGDREALGHRAVSKSGKLREDVPHPMALLLTALQFCDDLRVDRRLSIEESLEIEAISYGAGLLLGWFTNRASPSRSGR